MGLTPYRARKLQRPSWRHCNSPSGNLVLDGAKTVFFFATRENVDMSLQPVVPTTMEKDRTLSLVLDFVTRYNGFQIAFAHSATNKRSTLYNLTSNDNRQDESNLQQIQMVFDIFRPFSDHRSAVPFRTHHIHSPKDEKKDTKKDGIQPSDAMSDTI